MEPNQLKDLIAVVNKPFYESLEFWISTAIGVLGLAFSVLAFLEAKKAKAAADKAGAIVKIQTVTFELAEISQRLDKLEENITFPSARALLNELSRKLHRLVAPFRHKTETREACDKLLGALQTAKEALDSVRPEGEILIEQSPQTVYFAIQGHLVSISSLVADLVGLLEIQTMPGI